MGMGKKRRRRRRREKRSICCRTASWRRWPTPGGESAWPSQFSVKNAFMPLKDFCDLHWRMTYGVKLLCSLLQGCPHGRAGTPDLGAAAAAAPAGGASPGAWAVSAQGSCRTGGGACGGAGAGRGAAQQAVAERTRLSAAAPSGRRQALRRHAEARAQPTACPHSDAAALAAGIATETQAVRLDSFLYHYTFTACHNPWIYSMSQSLNGS